MRAHIDHVTVLHARQLKVQPCQYQVGREKRGNESRLYKNKEFGNPCVFYPLSAVSKKTVFQKMF
jgi:hypothetical protein